MGLRRRVIAAGLAGCLSLLSALVACGGRTPETVDPPDGGSSSSAPPARGSTAAPAGQYAVPSPGPRTERLWSADLLVFDQEALTEGVVARIRALPGVQAAESFSMAQAVIEGQAVNVAAVDPSSYRLFTPQAVADEQAVWDRVAGGEVAVTPARRNRLPIDREGWLELTPAAPRIHVGAYADQVPLIDLVLNQRWGEELGMTARNALLLSTGSTSPSTVRERIEKLIGDRASIQSLDIASRSGIDPEAWQKAVVVGGMADAVGSFTYRVLDGGRIAPDPAWVAAHISTEVVPILGEVTCNKALFPQLRAALLEVQQAGLAHEIHPEEYAGCYYPRFIAGTTTLSNHSFGLALDLNVPGNQRGTPGELHRGVVAIFKKWGFAWGGDWKWTDPMHFEMARLVRPG